MIEDKLHIVVCIKQTVSASGPAFTKAGGGKDLPMAMSPFDEFAVEEGVRIKERLNGKAVVPMVQGLGLDSTVASHWILTSRSPSLISQAKPLRFQPLGKVIPATYSVTSPYADHLTIRTQTLRDE